MICVSLVSGTNSGGVYEKIDKTIAGIPESQTTTVDQLGGYISRTFNTPETRIRAVFVWITGHIRYDVDNMQQTNYYEKEADLPPVTLRIRKGVCMDYAALFAALANKAGVKTYLVVGYTGIKGHVRMGMHAWCASRLTSGWYMFDPTWGAGYVLSGLFYYQRNENYYMIKPHEMIKTHIPFDPLWEFLNYPVDHAEFIHPERWGGTKKVFFNFTDSIRVFEGLSPEIKLLSANRRIKAAGITNTMVGDWVMNNEKQIKIIHNKEVVDLYNDAVKSYNDGISRMNDYVAYFNAHLNKPKEQEMLSTILNDAESLFNNANSKLNAITNPDDETFQSVRTLKASIGELLIRIRYKHRD